MGPSLAGLLIARIGVTVFFELTALSYVFFAAVLVAWRAPASTAPELPERFLSAMRAGSSYVLDPPVVRRILLRVTLFLIPASVVWTLLPLVATQRLGLGAEGYGLLLGALGAGAVAGAVVLPRFRSRFSLGYLIGA